MSDLDKQLCLNVNTAIANDELIRLPKPMTGFGVPNGHGLLTHRLVPILDVARGPPYVYYENVAMASRGVWATISSRLYDIVPEFVDSQYLCTAARKRGYIHNLPIHNRFQIQPPPPYTIQEAFPLTKKWWPSWDGRTKVNCLGTFIASAKLTDRLRKKLHEQYTMSEFEMRDTLTTPRNQNKNTQKCSIETRY